MAGELVHLAALLVEPHPAAALLDVVVLNLHCDGGADAREGVTHERYERAIAETDERVGLDRIEKRPHLLGREYRGLTLLHAVPWATDGVRGVQRDHLAGYEPIEEHPDGGEVLLHSRLGAGLHEQLDVAGNVDGLHLVKRKFVRFAPIGKPRDGHEVRL